MHDALLAITEHPIPSKYSGSSALRAEEHLSALLRKRPVPETFLAPFQSTSEFCTEHKNINSEVHKKVYYECKIKIHKIGNLIGT